MMFSCRKQMKTRHRCLHKEQPGCRHLSLDQSDTYIPGPHNPRKLFLRPLSQSLECFHRQLFQKAEPLSCLLSNKMFLLSNNFHCLARTLVDQILNYLLDFTRSSVIPPFLPHYTSILTIGNRLEWMYIESLNVILWFHLTNR